MIRALALFVIVMAAVLVGVSCGGQSGKEPDAISLGPYPFHTFPEVPLLKDEEIDAAVEVLRTDPATAHLLEAGTWSVSRTLPATDSGSNLMLGVYIEIGFAQPQSGSGPWLPIPCGKSSEPVKHAVQFTGIAALVDLETDRVAMLLPFVPDDEDDLEFVVPASTDRGCS